MNIDREIGPKGYDPYNHNGWSKLNGWYTARGPWLYWQDGDRTPNTRAGGMFTGAHGGGERKPDCAAQWDANHP